MSDAADEAVARGRALMGEKRVAEALAAFEEARKLAPERAELHVEVGEAREVLGRRRGAVRAYRDALERDAGCVAALEGLARVLRELQADEAEVLSVYDRILEVEPGNGWAAHMRAMMCGETTAAAPPGYVAQVFDGYAEHFDEHLRVQLEYRVPEMIGALVDGTGVARFARALDLGCGTGLVGAAVRDRVDRLVGIDLAPKMIEVARARAVYDELAVAEIVGWLGAAAAPRFDLVTAGDVLIYLGDLGPVMAAVRGRIEAGGWFMFTVERLDEGEADDAGVRLRPTGRYAHGRAHVAAAARAAGLELVSCEEVPLREDHGGTIHGWLCAARAL
jgi:predicted TPR repeat methyltransferase